MCSKGSLLLEKPQRSCCDLDSVMPVEQRLQRKNVSRGEAGVDYAAQLAANRRFTLPCGVSWSRQGEGTYVSSRHLPESLNLAGLRESDDRDRTCFSRGGQLCP